MTAKEQTPQATSRGALCAILLNPSFNMQNTISESNLAVAARALGFDSFQIVNLIRIQSRNSKELAQKATDEDAWLMSRPHIESALNFADEVVYAWGASRLAGQANRYKEEQVRWITRQTIHAGHKRVLLMDGSPRHPSRWRQYVGPQKMRVVGDTLEDRFRAALNYHSLGLATDASANHVSGSHAIASEPLARNEEIEPLVKEGEPS